MNDVFYNWSNNELDAYIKYMTELSRIFTKFTAERATRLKKESFQCLYSNCNQESQTYCHLLQRNGILTNIADNNHLAQLEIDNYHKWASVNQKSSPLIVNTNVGISKAFTGKLFCNYHDTSIFKQIEQTNNLNFNDYTTQLLFSYRAICNEMRSQEANLFMHSGSLVDESIYKYIKTLPTTYRVINELLNHINTSVRQFNYGLTQTTNNISNLRLLINEFEIELNSFQSNNKMYSFIHIETDMIPIACSAMFSSEDFAVKTLRNNPIFINVVPYANKTHIILGYHVGRLDNSIIEYMKKWQSFSTNEIKLELSRIICTLCTTWCMSPKFYHELSSDHKTALLKFYMYSLHNGMARTPKNYWEENQINLFEKLS